jgi:hypothetical protein
MAELRDGERSGDRRPADGDLGADETAQEKFYTDWGFGMKYMVIEHFRDHDPLPVYRRFRDRGRMAPEGPKYLSSWVDETAGRADRVSSSSTGVRVARRVTSAGSLTSMVSEPPLSDPSAR